METIANVNLDPIIPSQHELAQTHISTDRRSFMLLIEEKLQNLVDSFADPDTTSIVIDDKVYADKYAQGTIVAMNRYTTKLDANGAAYNSVWQSMVKFEKDISSLLG